MATNIALDDDLVELARRMGGHRTKRAAVTAALEEYIRYRSQLRILSLFGRVDFDPAYDRKATRRCPHLRRPSSQRALATKPSASRTPDKRR